MQSEASIRNKLYSLMEHDNVGLENGICIVLSTDEGLRTLDLHYFHRKTMFLAKSSSPKLFICIDLIQSKCHLFWKSLPFICPLWAKSAIAFGFRLGISHFAYPFWWDDNLIGADKLQNGCDSLLKHELVCIIKKLPIQWACSVCVEHTKCRMCLHSLEQCNLITKYLP